MRVESRSREQTANGHGPEGEATVRVRSWIPAGARTVTILFGVLALALGGCGSLSGGLHSDALSLAAPPSMVAAATPDEAIAPARDTDAVVVDTDAVVVDTDAAVVDTDAAVVVDATPVERVAVTDLVVAVGESVATPAAFDIASIELLRDEHVSSAFLALEDSMMVAQAPSGS